jgi:hypothetical protein
MCKLKPQKELHSTCFDGPNVVISLGYWLDNIKESTVSIRSVQFYNFINIQTNKQTRHNLNYYLVIVAVCGVILSTCRFSS